MELTRNPKRNRVKSISKNRTGTGGWWSLNKQWIGFTEKWAMELWEMRWVADLTLMMVEKVQLRYWVTNLTLSKSRMADGFFFFWSVVLWLYWVCVLYNKKKFVSWFESDFFWMTLHRHACSLLRCVHVRNRHAAIFAMFVLPSVKPFGYVPKLV